MQKQLPDWQNEKSQNTGVYKAVGKSLYHFRRSLTLASNGEILLFGICPKEIPVN